MVLGKLTDIPEPGAKGFDPWGVGQDTLLVVRSGGGIYAYRDLCPHYGDTRLPWKKDKYLSPQATTIVCAAHGAQFEITTGRCISGPCLNQYLSKVPVQVLANGDLLATLSESD